MSSTGSSNRSVATCQEPDRGRVTISTTHKYKGLEQSAVIVLDALDRSYPLIHTTWGVSPGFRRHHRGPRGGGTSTILRRDDARCRLLGHRYGRHSRQPISDRHAGTSTASGCLLGQF